MRGAQRIRGRLSLSPRAPAEIQEAAGASHRARGPCASLHPASDEFTTARPTPSPSLAHLAETLTGQRSPYPPYALAVMAPGQNTSRSCWGCG